MKKTIRENKKWRITLQTADSGECLGWNFRMGNGTATLCKFRLGPALATLETKQRFLWTTFWSRRELTNITSVAQEWIAKYFSDDEVIKGGIGDE